MTDAEDAYPDNSEHSDRLTVTVRCYDAANLTAFPAPEDPWEPEFVIDRVLLDFSEPWSMEFPPEASCLDAEDGDATNYVVEPLTSIEQADWDATEEQYREYTIGINYSICVEHGTLWMTEQWPVSVAQAEEAIEAFKYCPDHPDRAAIDERIAAAGVEQTERDEGVRFGSGLYRVGVDIQPGTYFSESDEGFENCYWERQDSAGEIIDNNFAGRVFRVEVTISETDYAFLSEGCGEWQLLE